MTIGVVLTMCSVWWLPTVVVESAVDTRANQNQNNVVNMIAFKQKRESTKSLTNNDRQPLVSTYAPNNQSMPVQDADFMERLQRIRSSIDRINRLMFEIKSLAKKKP